MVRNRKATGKTKTFGKLKVGDHFYVTPIVIGKVRCEKIVQREGQWTCDPVNAIVCDKSHPACGKIEFLVPDDEIVEIFPPEKIKTKG